jgi:methionyl-tRNA synthetase
MDVGGVLKLKILVTSAWPYLHSLPHLGNLVGSILSADVFARYCRLKGEDIIMVSGSDEHGTPVEVESVRLGISPKELTDKNHSRLTRLLEDWGISFDNYTRTENPIHKEFVKKTLMEIYNNGYIFTQETEMLYCEKCNRFLPDRYVEGKCPYCGYERARGDQCENCGRLLETTLLIEPYCAICHGKPVVKKTEHWYFDLPKLSQRVGEFLENNSRLASNTKNFSLSLIAEGLKPRAVTRDVNWGIQAPFPGAEDKRIYVWVEAVLGYVSATIEYFRNQGKPEEWKEYWFDEETRTYYFIGKDNIPFHTIILPALLLASGESYNLPWNVSATEFLQFKGEKASKSHKIGIYIDEALELFPADYWRYFLMATRPETKDSNFSWELFTERINADLNDTFGNFIHRTLTFINSKFNAIIPELKDMDDDAVEILKILAQKVSLIAEDLYSCKLQSAANNVISVSRIGNQYLNEKEPWNLVKTDKTEAANIFSVAARLVKALAIVSAPFVPFAADQIWKTLNLQGSVHQQKWADATDKFPVDHRINKPKPLFSKIEESPEQLEGKLQKIRKKQARTINVGAGP